MNIDFNDWWDEDDLTTQGNPFTEGTPAYWAWEGWCAGVKVEREAIYDEWWSCVMSDLENGVKSLNEKAAADWHKNYPAQSKMFPEWMEARETHEH